MIYQFYSASTPSVWNQTLRATLIYSARAPPLSWYSRWRISMAYGWSPSIRSRARTSRCTSRPPSRNIIARSKWSCAGRILPTRRYISLNWTCSNPPARTPATITPASWCISRRYKPMAGSTSFNWSHRCPRPCTSTALFQSISRRTRRSNMLSWPSMRSGKSIKAKWIRRRWSRCRSSCWSRWRFSIAKSCGSGWTHCWRDVLNPCRAPERPSRPFPSIPERMIS